MKKQLLNEQWHTLKVSDVFSSLKTSEEGLSENEAKERLNMIGQNSIDSEEGISPFRLIIRQINNPLIYLLIGAAVFSYFIGHNIDAAVIIGVIVLNTILGFTQEWRAEGALAALSRMAASHARVLRDGSPKNISALEVVPGDILILETGNRVAADARLIWSEELQVDESTLTGESEPVKKNLAVLENNTPLADKKNMVWMSTSITGGRCRAVVVATGMQTEVGKISAEVRSTSREKTPLQKRLHKLSIFIGIAGVTFALGVFGFGIFRGYKVIEMIMFSVAVAVSAIPEGLPAVISVTLAMGVRRMAARNAIIRRMTAVETLGSTTVICSDKTGTITKNQMTVKKIWAGGKTYNVSGEGYEPMGKIELEGKDKLNGFSGDLKMLLEIGLLCNNSMLKEKEGQWIVEGNPSEGAIIVAAIKAGLEKNLKEENRLSEIPFSSDRKYMATLHKVENDSWNIAFVKGAPERILDFCSNVLIGEKVLEIDTKRRNEIMELIERFSSEALRVMAGAYKHIPKNKFKLERTEIEEGLTLAGLWGIIDPPREESIVAVQEAKGAGIKPVMITGDHALTALAIAKAVGIVENGKVLTGKEIDSMENPELAKSALEYGVFARVTPAHKLKILESLKEKGHVVAMTGDGVNDAPALKGADIGVAMGIAGTEVAREAADMILTDDNFATIVHAVEEGRIIYNNLRNVIFFLLSTNLGEIIILIAALSLGLDLPLTAVMVLWINLVTDGACTVPLGLEPGHASILKQPPRDPKEFIIDRVTALRMALLTPIMAIGTIGLFWYSSKNGNLDYARTIAFTTLAAFQWFQALNARSTRSSIFSIGLFTNRWVLFGISLAIILQIIAVQTPVGHTIFGTTSLSIKNWLMVVLVSSSIWITDELLKLIGIYKKLGKGLRKSRKKL